MRVGQTAVLDHGPASFTNPTLGMQSELVTDAVEGTYKVAVTVHGEVVVTAVAWQSHTYNHPTTPQLQAGTVSTDDPDVAYMRVALTAVLDEGWLTFADITLTTLSQPIPVHNGQLYRLGVNVNGELSAPEGEGGQIFLVYDGDTANPELAWPNPVNFDGSSTAEYTFIPPVGTDELRVGLEARLDKGWLAYSDLALTAFTDPFPLVNNTTYELTAEVAGTNADMALDVVHADTLIPYQTVWSDTGYTGSGEREGGMFIDPSGSVRLAQTAVLGYGPASFTAPTLAVESGLTPAVAEGTYKVTGIVFDSLQNVPPGQYEARVMAVAYDSGGAPIGEPIELWSGHCNTPMCPFDEQFVTPSGTSSLRLFLAGYVGEGQVGVTVTALSYYDPGYSIQRSSYSLAGQAIAVRVQGDPDGNDGLFYIHSDHLGSASVMSDETGAVVPDSQARYYPFGGWRGTPPATNPAVTDRGFGDLRSQAQPQRRPGADLHERTLLCAKHEPLLVSRYYCTRPHQPAKFQ